MSELSKERRMWSLFEPVHAVTYFARDALGTFEEAGLRGFWRGYFAGRCAPLGAVGPGPVIAAFYGFAPRMVTRALPDVWTRITPEAALRARRTGARCALMQALEDLPDEQVIEAAELLRAAASTVELAGRVLGAANALLPWPDEPGGSAEQAGASAEQAGASAGAIDVLWHAATILREHRGDGHAAALLLAGIDGCETNVWRVALLDVDGEDAGGRAFYQPARGWTDEEWDAAADRLRSRGWVDGEGRATEAARDAYHRIERTTDELAAGPWRRLGADATERCAQVLLPIAVRASKLLRHPNPIGLPRL